MVTWSSPSVGGERMVPGGTTSGGGRSSPSSKPSVPVQTNEQRNAIFEQYRAGKISQAQAIGQIRGAAAQASFQAKLVAQQQQQEMHKQQQNNKKIYTTKNYNQKQSGRCKSWRY